MCTGLNRRNKKQILKCMCPDTLEFDDNHHWDMTVILNIFSLTFLFVYDSIPCYSILTLFFPWAILMSPLKLMIPFGLDCSVLCICFYKVIVGLCYQSDTKYLCKFSLIKQVVYEYTLIVKFNKQKQVKLIFLNRHSSCPVHLYEFCILPPLNIVV